jgi:hypothetical protein
MAGAKSLLLGSVALAEPSESILTDALGSVSALKSRASVRAGGSSRHRRLVQRFQKRGQRDLVERESQLAAAVEPARVLR